MTINVHTRFAEWIRTLNDVDAWSHCGRIGVHSPHVYDTAVNEGPIPNVQCIGIPDLTQPTTTPPILEQL